MIGTNKKVNIQSNSDFHIFDNLQEEVIVYEIMRDMLDIIVDLRVKYVNNAAIINEIVPEKVIGKTITELYDADVAVLHLKMANKVLKSGEGKKYEAYFEPLNRYYSVSAYLPDDNTYVTISRNITEPKKAEEAFNKELYKGFLNNPFNGFALCEIVADNNREIIDFVFLKVNKAFENFTGFKREEVLNKKATEVFPIEEIAPAIKLYNRMALTGESEQFEMTIPSLDKIYNVIVFALGKKQFIIMFNDITKQKKTEEKLQKQADLLNLTRDAIIVRDMGDRIIFWNHGAEERYGWTKKEAYGKVAHNLLKNEFSVPLAKVFNPLFQDGHWEGELTQTRRDGTKIVVSSRWALQKNENNEPIGFMEINTDITEHKKADRALKENESKLKAIIDYSPDAIAVTDLNGKLIECNAVALDLFGFTSKEEIIGLNTFDLIAPEDRVEALQDMEKTLSGRYVKDVEFNLLASNGRIFPSELSVGLILDNDKPSAFVCIIKDITERKKVEEELRQIRDNLEEKVEERTVELEEAYDALKENEEKFREIFNNANDMITLAESDAENCLPGKYIEVNQVGCERLGYSRDEFLKMTPADIIAPERGAEMRKNGAKLVKNGYIRFEIVHIAKDGKRIPVEVSTHLFKLGGKEVMLAISRDISERKKAEKEIKDSEKQLRMITNNMTDMVSQTDINGVLQYVSPSHKLILGYELEDLLGKSIYDLVHPDDLERVKKATGNAITTGMPDKIEVRFSHADGRYVWLEIVGNLLFDEKHLIKGAVFDSRDISERKKMEETLRKSEHKFRSVIEQSSNGIALCDEQGKIIEWNETLEKITGIKREEVIGNLLWDVLFRLVIEERKTPEVYEYIKATKLEIFKTGKVPWGNQVQEVEIQRIDGKHRFIEEMIFTVPTDKSFMACAILQDITDRKKMEETLRESEQKFRSVVKQAYNGIVLCDEQGIIIEWNKTQEKISGIKQEEVIGKFIWDVSFHSAIEEFKTPEAYENLKAALLKVFKTGKVPWDTHSRELEIQRPDGERRFIEEMVFTIPTGKGFMTCSMIQDITDRKKMEETLRESEQKFRSVVEQSYNGITLCNEQGIIIEWNHTQEMITGKKRSEVIGKFLWDVSFHSAIEERKTSEAYENVKAALLKMFKTGKVPQDHQAQEQEIQRPDGERRFIEELAFTIQTDKGFMACGITQDITDRKKIEEALKESEEKFRETLQQSYDGISITNKQGTIIEWNPALEQITGLKKEDIIGKSIWDAHYQVIPEEKRTSELVEKIKSRVMPLLEGKNIIKESQIIDKEIQRLDGKRRFMQSIDFPIKTERGILLGSFNRDITERKKAEKQLKETVEELKRSNAELQRFAYVASHDLQEPLRTVASFTQLLERRYKGKLDDDADEFMGYIVEAAIRMKELIEALLDYSRIATKLGEFKSVDGELILGQTIDNLQYAIEESNAKVTYDSMPVIMGDEVQLQRVFQNLISNAIKFKKEEEPLEVHISAIKDENNNEHVFSVQDNGIGIEKQYFERIFTIFQRLHTREEYNGTGIGLSIVKKIVERHGGCIWLESEPNVGSTFYFTLPKS